MIELDKTLISRDVIQEKFHCDLSKCKGACCVEGDSGAPLTQEELTILDHDIEIIKKYMRPEGIKAIEQQGNYVIDNDKEYVTPLIEGKECAFVVFEKNIAFCSIEKAFLDKAISLQKPLSCHLYPIRLKKYRDFTAVNYDIWPICNPARKYGKDINSPVYKFCKQGLIRKFGEAYYGKLIDIAQKI